MLKERSLSVTVKLWVVSTLLVSQFTWGCYTDPLIVDIGKDRIDLGEKGIGVDYDFMGWELPVPVQWFREGGNEALLVRDFNGNGKVDSGQELFGDNIRLQDGTGMARNGFQALAQFDLPLLGGNDDGKITQDDAIWFELSLWLDKNADGISTEDEMLTLESQGIKSFDVIPNEMNYYDSAGNHISLWDWVEGERKNREGKIKKVKYKMYDVTFSPLP